MTSRQHQEHHCAGASRPRASVLAPVEEQDRIFFASRYWAFEMMLECGVNISACILCSRILNADKCQTAARNDRSPIFYVDFIAAIRVLWALACLLASRQHKEDAKIRCIFLLGSLLSLIITIYESIRRTNLSSKSSSKRDDEISAPSPPHSCSCYFLFRRRLPHVS